jgi:hypothetical protein
VRVGAAWRLAVNERLRNTCGRNEHCESGHLRLDRNDEKCKEKGLMDEKSRFHGAV